MGIQLSVVVPVKNEEENVAPLAHEIVAALATAAPYEIIFVDDGSTDATEAALIRLRHEIPHLRILAHDRNCGQSRALRTGMRAAKGEIVITLDGDGQNDPADIPKLLAAMESADSNVALVTGVRVKRQDAWRKRAASRLANGVRSRLLNDRAVDVGCGLKVYRRDAFLALPYFDHMHRYIVGLMQREGYEVAFVDVSHRPRRHGRSKYGVWDRLAVSATDIFGVMWLKRRFRGPTNTREL